MDFWTFAANNPVTAVILVYLLFCPVRYAFRAYNRKMRSANICAQGWPPAHLDADGDFKDN